MQVKWEKRSPPNQSRPNSISLNALLVKPYPYPGSVKHQIIEHLGSIEEKFLDTKVRNMREFHQGLFWTAVGRKLDHLGLDAHERNKIEAEISQTVSIPDEDWALWGVTCIPIFDP